MPYKNQVKEFDSGSIHHVYARGINKMPIYRDSSDYKFFLYLLKKYLTKDFKEIKKVNGIDIDFPANSMYGSVELIVFCLMPNHFHLLLRNLNETGVTGLMKRVMSNYSVFFNKKYLRQGTLFQGSYRAVAVRDERQYITSGIYIHINPVKDKLVTNIKDYEYSSFKYYYLGNKAKWLVVDDELKMAFDYTNIKRYLRDYSQSEYADIL